MSFDDDDDESKNNVNNNNRNNDTNENKNNIFLLVHTMTITQCEYEVEAQYYHAFENTRIDTARYVGRRLKLKIHPSLIINNNKGNLYRLLFTSNLRTLMKQNSAKIKHRIRTIPIPNNKYVFIIFVKIINNF